MSTEQSAYRRPWGTALATGGVVFAATIMILVGMFQFFQGLAAIVTEDLFVVAEDYAYELDPTAWGWIHLILGIIVVAAGIYLISGSTVASWIAIGLAGVSALSNFFFIPYYPFWSLLIVALAVFVIWAIIRANAPNA